MDRRNFLKEIATATLYPALVSGNSKPNIKDIFISSQMDNITTLDNKLVDFEKDITLFPVIEIEINNNKQYITEANNLVIDNKKIDSKIIKRWDKSFGDIKIQWSKVEPLSKSYSNISPEWHWDKVDYQETPLDWNPWENTADVSPTLMPQVKIGNKSVGTMRFKLEVQYNGKKFSTPGKEAIAKNKYGPIGGIEDIVHRISIKGKTSSPILDCAFAMCNSPYIWGSASPSGDKYDNQAIRFIGADCADLIVGAANLSGKKVPFGGSIHLHPKNNSNKYTKTLFSNIQLSKNGIYHSNGKPIPFGLKGVQPGDIIHYSSHVGLLVTDTQCDGIFGLYKIPPNRFLDKDDLILHTLFYPPITEKISEAYGSEFNIERFI